MAKWSTTRLGGTLYRINPNGGYENGNIMSFEEMEFFEKARYEIEGFYEPSQRARDDGVMELSTRNGFCSKADVEEKSFRIQIQMSYSLSFSRFRYRIVSLWERF